MERRRKENIITGSYQTEGHYVVVGLRGTHILLQQLRKCKSDKRLALKEIESKKRKYNTIEALSYIQCFHHMSNGFPLSYPPLQFHSRCKVSLYEMLSRNKKKREGKGGE